MSAVLFGLLGALALAILGGLVLAAKNLVSKSDPARFLIELSGEMGLTYYKENEGKPAFATGTYSGRGVTLDGLNEKGYYDCWHPHSRVVVSVDKSIRDTHIVAKRGRFYSRKLGEVDVDHPKFKTDYVFLSSSPKKAQNIVTKKVAGWVVRLDMPFTLSSGHVIFHQEREFKDLKRVTHIVDALVYIANAAERNR